MSFFSQDNLRSSEDNRIPTETRIFVIPPAGFREEFMLESNKLIKTFKIINNDASEVLQYKLHSSFNEVIRTVPPNSDDIVSEWTNYIEILPSNITNDGALEVDLADPDDAKRIVGS